MEGAIEMRILVNIDCSSNTMGYTIRLLQPNMLLSRSFVPTQAGCHAKNMSQGAQLAILWEHMGLP